MKSLVVVHNIHISLSPQKAVSDRVKKWQHHHHHRRLAPLPFNPPPPLHYQASLLLPSLTPCLTPHPTKPLPPAPLRPPHAQLKLQRNPPAAPNANASKVPKSSRTRKNNPRRNVRNEATHLPPNPPKNRRPEKPRQRKQQHRKRGNPSSSSRGWRYRKMLLQHRSPPRGPFRTSMRPGKKTACRPSNGHSKATRSTAWMSSATPSTSVSPPECRPQKISSSLAARRSCDVFGVLGMLRLPDRRHRGCYRHQLD